MFDDDQDDPAEPSISDLQPPREATHSVAGWLQWTGPDVDDPGEVVAPPTVPLRYGAASFEPVEIVEGDEPEVPLRYRLQAVALDRFTAWGMLHRDYPEE